MEPWIRTGLVILGTVLGSGGFWAYLRSRDTRRDATTRLMMGLAYDRLIDLGLKYIDRGSITEGEFSDYSKYFFEPYKDLGGNGVAERIMAQVSRLPFRTRTEYAEIFRDHDQERFINNVRVTSPPERRQEGSFE